MGLETGDKISDLNPGWPLGSDPKSQGDDHLRLLKVVFQNDVVSRAEGGIFEGNLTVQNAAPHLRLHHTGTNALFELSGETTAGSVFYNVDRNAVFTDTAVHRFRVAGVTAAEITREGTALGSTVTVATREKGDARWTQSFAMELLLSDLVANATLTVAQSDAILALMVVEP